MLHPWQILPCICKPYVSGCRCNLPLSQSNNLSRNYKGTREAYFQDLCPTYMSSIKMVTKFQLPESLNALSSLGNEQQWGQLFLWSMFHHSSSVFHCTWLIHQLSFETARPKPQTRQIHVKGCGFHGSMRLFEWNLTFAIFHSLVFSSFLSAQAEQPMEILPPIRQNQHLS